MSPSAVEGGDGEPADLLLVVFRGFHQARQDRPVGREELEELFAAFLVVGDGLGLGHPPRRGRADSSENEPSASTVTAPAPSSVVEFEPVSILTGPSAA